MGRFFSIVNALKKQEWYTGVDEVGRNSNSLVVCDEISHVLVVVHGVSL